MEFEDGQIYHVFNRGNNSQTVFFSNENYQNFLDKMEEYIKPFASILAWCLMPNHFHLALWPREDGELSRWMHCLMTAHVRRSSRHYRSSGHV